MKKVMRSDLERDAMMEASCSPAEENGVSELERCFFPERTVQKVESAALDPVPVAGRSGHGVSNPNPSHGVKTYSCAKFLTLSSLVLTRLTFCFSKSSGVISFKWAPKPSQRASILSSRYSAVLSLWT